MKIGKRIKERRMELGISSEELGKAIGKSRATIYRYENGEIEKFPLEALVPIAKALSTTPAYLMGWTDDPADSGTPEKTIPVYENIEPIATQSLPVYDGIAAGKPRFMNDKIQLYASVTTDVKADFILKVHGDSMIGARINDGDLVFIHQQPEVENGEIAAVAIGDEATLKRFYKYGDTVVLRPENPTYSEMIYSGSDLISVHILGKAVAFQSDIK